ncbi:MAG: CinA family protein [Anaerolineaceae bacterium]
MIVYNEKNAAEALLETGPENLIGKLLLDKKLKLVVAESCTGGLISDWVTNIPGSSEYYLGGVTSYAYEAKRQVLGVKPQTLDDYGAVSRPTVIEMAVGVRRLFSGEISPEQIVSLSVSGIAGPGGGTEEKPVGTAWIGLSAPDGDWAWKYIWNGDRLENKAYFARMALNLMIAYLKDNLPPEVYV